ncbi:hypothetical protein GWK47_034417 [Chionoecetes opilio]|uniref:Uncharacterized protein n=1 Tax=Chionoecetes opilio TaxID=41210 RepID=A0A8J5D2Y6_CHIOP|nr:hypothetical protein GWK47_034417 [Chionoecetes opilio]
MVFASHATPLSCAVEQKARRKAVLMARETLWLAFGTTIIKQSRSNQSSYIISERLLQKRKATQQALTSGGGRLVGRHAQSLWAHVVTFPLGQIMHNHLWAA